ncbi:peptidoglycan endopeptidase [Trinickia violacea]|uniref:Peptidoglycan endopeptidase n=1 Tax=Trinickia violacea TaxID=2571746 RepID=A0A4P8IQN8_9BURK|nr:C40 family peptidase [Trinickia violacea]QCP49423.1 peptidoglycan endopeptidase [Trinickia violacea]
MRRLWFPLLIVLLLAACSSAPQQYSRSSGSAGSAGGAYRTEPPPGFPTAGLPNFVDHSIGREEISIQAMGLVGVPYRWGGNTPDAGFDCSGLVRYVVLRAASVNLPRTTADMSSRGESIEPDEIAPGDLIFFNTTGRPHSHVGIYVGKLRFVNAPSTGGTVRLDYLTNAYWAKRFDGIRRVAPALDKPAPLDAPTYLAAPREAPAPSSPVPTTAGTAYATAGSASAPPLGAPADSNPAVAAPNRNLTAVAVAPAAAPPGPAADPFEPPPPGMSAAQVQARAAGAVLPSVTAAAQQPAGIAPATTQASGAAGAPASSLTTAAPARNAPDAIDAAADAFEPPPPAAVAERQAQQARQAAAPASPAATSSVRIMRASTASPSMPAPTSTSDDPIARFANGGD